MQHRLEARVALNAWVSTCFQSSSLMSIATAERTGLEVDFPFLWITFTINGMMYILGDENPVSLENEADAVSVDEVVQFLKQILRLYKELGPQSMESLTASYLTSAPTAESAKNVAEEAMAQAFKVFDEATNSVLKTFAARKGFDLSKSKNYQRRMDEGYFRVFYPVMVMYTAWLDREGQKKALDSLGDIFRSIMLGVAGFEILDSNLDEGKANPPEILLSLSFIQESERLLLESFDFDSEDYELLNRFKQLFLVAEIREKQSRFVKSPYTKEHPEDCGYKAVHGYLPFAILLQKTGKADQIDEYLQFFYEWGAPLQTMDDLTDLEEDIKNGHYSYPTLGFEEELIKRSPSELAAMIRSDKVHIEHLRRIFKALLESSRARCKKLKADLFGYFVEILEARFDAYFADLVKNTEP